MEIIVKTEVVTYDQLTDREKQIYDKGFEDGHKDAFGSWILLGFILIMLVFCLIMAHFE